MREYPVPFSTKGESPFMGGLSIREMLWIGGGFIVGLTAAIAFFALLRTETRSMIVSFPVIIPFVCLGFYLARKKITEDDKKETLDRHCLKLFKYRRRPHIYLNYRKEGG